MADSPGRPDIWQTLAKLLLALVAAGVLVAGLALPYVGGLGLVAGHEADKFQNTTCTLQESAPPQRTTLYARDGKTVLATLFNQDRVPVPLSQVPQYLQDALVATEDRRFYSHHGVDLRGLLRSAVNTSSGDTQGGSTLTMQYVKQIRYYQAGDNPAKQAAAISQNLNRKIEDAKCALYIEGTLHESKKTILDNYLNIAFFGENSYGIQTAAETYFDKPVSQLTLGESAMLVGMLRAPSAYDPFLHRAAATQRRNEVLQNLVATHKLDQHTASVEEAKPISLATQAPPVVKQGCANASSSIPNSAFFCEYAVNWLETVNKMSPNLLQTGGLKIVTTLDASLQRHAQQQVSAAIPSGSPMTAVLPAVDPKTGDVLAMAASKSYGAGKGQTEQPIFTAHVANGASTYKLFPLLAALQMGVPNDWPLLTTGNSGTYTTKYCSSKSKSSNGDANVNYNAQETLASATAKSSNTYFVGLADNLFECQLQPMVSLAESLGMNGLDDASPDQAGQTVGQEIVSAQRAQQFVLGSVPTSPLELAGAYAAVANGGKFNAPAPILSITDSNGSAMPLKRAPATQVVSPQAAANALEILTGDTKAGNDGTSVSKFQSWYGAGGSDVAGKTGTVAAVNSKGKETSSNAAIWFVGVTDRLAAVSALINFDSPNSPSRGLPNVGDGKAYGDYASGLWVKAFSAPLVHQNWTWPSPDSVSGQQVPDITGMSVSDARAALAADHFTLSIVGAGSNLLCPDKDATIDTIGYYGPSIAPAGSTILACQSLGVGQPVYVAPPPPPVTQRTGNGSSNHSPTPGSSTGHSGGSTGSSGGSSGSTGGGHGGSGGGTGHGGSGGAPKPSKAPKPPGH